MTHNSQLGSKVFARNRCNTLVKDYVTKAVALFTPLMGKKIVKKTTNGFNDKVKNEIAAVFGELPCNGALHVRIYADSFWGGYNLKVTVTLTEQYDDPNKAGRNQGYEDASSTIYFGECDTEGVLTKFSDNMHLDSYRTDYTVDEVKAARKELADAQKLVDAAKSKLNYFGEHERY